MNILIIPAFFQTKQRPTLGSFFGEQALALKEAGHDVAVLYCDTYSVKCIKDYIGYSEKGMENIQGISIYRKRVFCPLKHGIEGHRDAFSNAVLELYDKYASEGKKADVIHAHCCVWAGYAAMKLSEKTKIPYVITEHATLFQLHKDKIKGKNRECISDAFRKAARIVCVSRAFGELIREYSDNIEIIGNVVDCKRFCIQKEHETKYKNNKCSFLAVCYMGDEAQLHKKGIDLLLEAWAEIAEKYPNAKLIIGGGGKASEKVVEWINRYNISDSVELIGALSRDEVAMQMQQCDCFALPSRYETFGVVYIEAMACGKPVIAAANGGPDDFVKDFNGILIKPEDKDELVSAMEKMINVLGEPDAAYQPEKIAAYVRENFSSEAIAQKLEELYSGLVGNCREGSC